MQTLKGPGVFRVSPRKKRRGGGREEGAGATD